MTILDRSYRFIKSKIGLLTWGAAALFCTMMYYLRSAAIKPNFTILFCTTYFEILLLGIICTFIGAKIKYLFQRYKKHKKTRKIQRQILTIFSIATIIPAISVFVFATLFFNLGIEHLFKSPVKNIIDNATKVSEVYIEDMKLTLQNYSIGLAGAMKKTKIGEILDLDQIADALNRETSDNQIDAMLFQVLDDNSFNILVKPDFSLSIQYLFPQINFRTLPIGTCLVYEMNGFIATLQKLSSEMNLFLIIASPLNQIIVDHTNQIISANTQYMNLMAKRTGIKLSFMMFLAIVTLLLLLSAILSGLILANNILAPVSQLITATKSIGSGNYTPIVPVKKFNNEWDELITTFNDMVNQLENQKQQLIISNKQIAWRDLARKIAHEIKNPLTPILLSTERIKNKYRNEITTSPEIFDRSLDTIARQVRSISNLINEFSHFARMPTPQLEHRDIIAVLQEIILLQSGAHKNISFRQDFEKEEIWCKFDASQINQVFMNLFQNAINSISENNTMSDTGILGIISTQCYLRDGRVFVIIEDDGPGFDESALNRAFEPYFTTRKEGTGLGLAIVYKILSDHGGGIVLGRSESLQGAKVAVSIPVE